MYYGYIGLTDPEWYSFLSVQKKIDEVNFWQPHGNRTFRAISKGCPFFFKLRNPQKAIAGFGFFEKFEIMPAWLAWQCFGEMNGAPTFPSMINRISRLRNEKEPHPGAGNFPIGCIMISAPVFFDRDSWVKPPTDWAKTGIQQGKTYQLEVGEGQRVFRECLERAKTGNRYWNIEPENTNDQRYGSPLLVRPRLGQGLFSVAVRDAYNKACAVTHEHSMPVLEAAHIIPYGRGGEHRVDNGLLLRSDLHRLYDAGYVTVSPDMKFLVGERLREEFHNGRAYYPLSGSRIVIPNNPVLQPNPEALDWHMSEVFLG